MTDYNPRTIGRWIHLPTAGGASDRFRADQPLGAGLMQIASSNATLGARENNLRTLASFPGWPEVAGDLTHDNNPDSFDWDADPGPTTVRVVYAGTHRMRRHACTGSYPQIACMFQMDTSGAGDTAGLILVARPRMGRPTAGDVSVAFTSAVSGRFTILLPINEGNVGSRLHTPTTDSTTLPSPLPVESGRDEQVVLYLGIWNHGGGKTSIGGLTLYLVPPP